MPRHVRELEREVTAAPTTPVAQPHLLRRDAVSPDALLALQGGAGNRAATAWLSRQATVVEEDAPKAEAPYLQWSKDDVRPIQRELRRLRLYNLGIDGVLGKGSDQGLVEAFGGDEWRTLDAATVLQRLTSAERPKGGKGHDVRYGELFKDGLLDLTFGYGFMEELDEAGWAQYAKDIEDALAARGYSEDAGRAAELYKAAERGTNGFGRFFVKESALTYTPPAGPPRNIPAIVRFIMNPSGEKGAEARQAFEEGMAQGDAAYYSGHGRYGSGPDFDRNFGSFTLKAADGTVEQVIEDYEVLGKVLAKEGGGGAWAQFLKRWNAGRLEVDFSNAGNLRLNAKNLHPGEFGGKLIQWAMDQTGQTAVTGRRRRAGADGGRQARSQVPHAGVRRLPHQGLREGDPQDPGLRHPLHRPHPDHPHRRLRRRGGGADGVPRRPRGPAVRGGGREGDEQGDEGERAGVHRRALRGQRLRRQPVAMSAADLLAHPGDWPRAASELAAAGDPSVLPDLVAAYDQPVEASRGELLDAMEALGGGSEARRLAESSDAAERRVAARLMQLLPEPEHVAALERLAADDDGAVAAAARKALRGQRRTPAWRAAVERLAASDDADLRAAAESWQAEG